MINQPYLRKNLSDRRRNKRIPPRHWYHRDIVWIGIAVFISAFFFTWLFMPKAEAAEKEMHVVVIRECVQPIPPAAATPRPQLVAL